MEKILKLQSDQGFTETAVPQAFINSKLLDFTIPGSNGVSYDLGKSYIQLNMNVVPGNNVAASAAGLFTAGESLNPEMYNNDICLSTDAAAGDEYLADCATIVRNASLTSTNKGMVESIRRVNTLRGILWNMENDKAEQHDGLSKFGSFQGRRGLNNSTSSMVQVIGLNTRIDGTVDATKTAQNLSRDFRIPLSDLFGVGSAMWNADVFGDTRIHLEIQPNLMKIQQLGGEEDTSLFTGAGELWGGMLPLDGTALPSQPLLPAAAGLGTVAHPLISKITYDNAGLDYPFYVGQAIEVKFNKTITGGAGPTAETKYAIIESLHYNNGDNSANPPTDTNRGSIALVTRNAIYNAGAGATETIAAITVNALKSKAADDKIRINRAEIVLSEMVGAVGPTSIDYTTYSTEETQVAAGLLQVNRQIIVEPNAQNLIVASCSTGMTAPDREWTSYRMAINNKDVCGNRDVNYNHPLHKDRIHRFFNNRGQNVSNTTLKLINQGLQATDGNQISFYPILETLPLTQEQKLVNMEIISNGAATSKDIIYFKELQRTI